MLIKNQLWTPPMTHENTMEGVSKAAWDNYSDMKR